MTHRRARPLIQTPTYDTRDMQAIPVIEGLKSRGAELVAYDPVEIEDMRKHFPDIKYVPNPATALQDSLAALIVTDWG